MSQGLEVSRISPSFAFACRLVPWPWSCGSSGLALKQAMRAQPGAAGQTAVSVGSKEQS